MKKRLNKFDIGQFEFKEVSRKDTQKGIIEAMLFVSGEPLSLRDIAINLEATPKYVEELLEEMIKEYDEISRGIKLISINGAYQLVTKAEHSDYIQKLLKKNKRQSLSQASLESLAIVAYKQPTEGVNISGVIVATTIKSISSPLSFDLSSAIFAALMEI